MTNYGKAAKLGWHVKGCGLIPLVYISNNAVIGFPMVAIFLPCIVKLNQTLRFNNIIRYDKIKLDVYIINYEFLIICVILEGNMVTDILCQIHYCKRQNLKDPGKVTYEVTRTLQHHEIIFVCEGNGHIVIGENRYLMKKGMLFYIPPGVRQTIEPRAQNPEHYMTVHFSGSRMGLNPDGKWKYLENIQNLRQPSAQKITYYTPLEELFEKLLDTWNDKGPSYEFIAATLLRQLLIWVSQNKIKQSKNQAIFLKIDQIIEYMRQNINRKVTLEELSGIARLSTFYLSRTFKEATGYPIIKYFNKMKIEKAKELLIDGNKKVKEVAYELGYTNEFYFSRMFKRVEGLSPKEFYSKNVYEF